MLIDEAFRALLREELRKVLREERSHVHAQPAPNHSAEYLSIKEAALAAGVSVSTVRNWVKRDQLKVSGPGRTARIRRADLDELLRKPRSDDAIEVEDVISSVLKRRKTA